MKKFVALFALSASIVYAVDTTTTSTKKIDVSQQSFSERVGGYYYTVLSKDVLSGENTNVPGSSWLNYLNASYKLTNETKVAVTMRFEIIDSNHENGRGDRFSELDPRLGISTKLFSKGIFSVNAYMVVELPTSRESQDDERIMRLKPAIDMATKIDDYNSLMTYIGYNKTIYSEANNGVDETSRHYLEPWIVYTNKYLSEKFVFKAEYSSTLDHVAGTADSTLRKEDSGEELALGVEFDALGFALNPYIAHNPSALKAVNTLGAGIQAFKAF